MSGNILITEADRCDIPELVKLRVEYLKEAFGSISVEELARLSDELTEYFGRTLGKSCAAFVAKDGESVVSSAVLVIYERPVSPSLKTGLIGETVSVYTKPEYRRRGLCSKVIKAMVDYIMAKLTDLTASNLMPQKWERRCTKNRGFPYTIRPTFP